jgi:TatA/E family protein of Tat protein translocase
MRKPSLHDGAAGSGKGLWNRVLSFGQNTFTWRKITVGSLGWQEMMLLFLLALIIFGPKKLPELGRTLGKAITEFRRASSDLRSTFDREMKTLEQETESIKQEVASAQYQYDTYNYDYANYDSGELSCGSPSDDSTASDPSNLSASATQGAESTEVASPEGTIAYGSDLAYSNGINENSSPDHEGESKQPVTTTDSNA